MKNPFIYFDKRKKRWYIRYFDPYDKPHNQSTGEKFKGKAEIALANFQPPYFYPNVNSPSTSLLDPGRVASIPDDGPLTLEKYHAKFETFAADKYSKMTQKHFKVAMRMFMEFVGKDKLIAAVTKEEVERFLARREKVNGNPWSARKYYTALASMFERAKGWDILNDNVWRTVKKPGEGEREVIFFKPKDFDTFLTKVGEFDKNLYIFAVHTGMRLAEICNSKWEHINYEENYIRVVNGPTFKTKNRRSRNIPMSKTLKSTLEKIVRDGEYIFGGAKPNTVSQYFGDYIDANLWLDQRLHFHSLRHTFASWLVQRHVPLMEVQKLMGHAKISTTEIYAHLLQDTLQDAISVLD